MEISCANIIPISDSINICLKNINLFDILKSLSLLSPLAILPYFIFKKSEFEKYKDERVEIINKWKEKMTELSNNFQKSLKDSDLDEIIRHLEVGCNYLVCRSLSSKIARYEILTHLYDYLDLLLTLDTEYKPKDSKGKISTKYLILQDCYNMYCRNFVLRAWYKIIIRLRIFCRGY